MAYYDFEDRARDVALFFRARQELSLFGAGDVEDAWGDTEAVMAMLTDLLVERTRAKAEALGKTLRAEDVTHFQKAVSEAFEDLYAPVQTAIDRAWREDADDPNAEHRLGASDYGVGRYAA